MRLYDQVLSEEDFEQLPPALRRKYFSSLERLRLANDGCPSNSRSRPRSSKRPSISHTLSSRSRSLPAIDHRSFSISSTSRARLRKPSRTFCTSPIPLTPHEFAALPPAIRRKHFSAEEQYYIASHYAPVILDAADEALYKQYQPHRDTATSHSLDIVHEDEDENDWEDSEFDEEDLEDMDIKDLGGFRWLDDDHELDLKLDDYHAISQEVNNKQSSASAYRHSFRRGLSLSNITFRRHSSSSTSIPSPSPSGLSINKHASPQAPTLLQPKHLRRDSTSSSDPAATHYQDPAAKMKLRVYLASPQKFDEALEFGFPSLQREAVHVSGRPKTTPGNANGQPKTFFADDTPSLSEDDGTEHVRQDSPRTPIDMMFPGQRLSQNPSTDRVSQYRIRINPEMYGHASATEREMTLKMTLTRPELRNIEEADHTASYSVNDRPLERAPLMVPFDSTRAIWDELPEEPSRMKRFFKKLKGRS